MEKAISFLKEATWLLIALSVLVFTITLYKCVDKADTAKEVVEVVTAIKDVPASIIEFVKETK